MWQGPGFDSRSRKMTKMDAKNGRYNWQSSCCEDKSAPLHARYLIHHIWSINKSVPVWPGSYKLDRSVIYSQRSVYNASQRKISDKAYIQQTCLPLGQKPMAETWNRNFLESSRRFRDTKTSRSHGEVSICVIFNDARRVFRAQKFPPVNASEYVSSALP